MINIMLRLIAQPSVLSRFSLFFAIGLAVTAITTPVQAQSYPGNAPADSRAPRTEEQGGEVAALQQRLAELGYYSGPVTGYFDPATQAAVTQFQQSNGLAPDGIVGPATSNALYQAGSAAPTNPVDSPASSQPYAGDVAGLQQQLSQWGYYTGAANGVLDEQTQSAIMNFQRDRGLAVDGIVGPATQAALSQAPAQPDIAAATPATQTPATAEASTYTPTATPEDGLLQLGDVGAEVSTLQTQLQALGYYDGPISGSFGSQTQSALIAFQQAQGLTADGIAGPRVSSALGSAAAPATATQPTPTQTAAATVPPATIVQPAVQPAVQSVTQPATQPVATTSQPGTIAVPPINSIQSPQPTTSTVQVPAIAPSMPATQPMAQSALPPATNSPVRSSEGGRYSVMELQRRLQLRGFDPVEMTGVYDSVTQNAITQAQQAYGLSQGDLFEHY